MAILQLNPPLLMNSPKGPGLAHFLIDNGPEEHLYFVIFQDNGEIWTFANPYLRACKNITMGRVEPSLPPTMEEIKNLAPKLNK